MVVPCRHFSRILSCTNSVKLKGVSQRHFVPRHVCTYETFKGIEFQCHKVKSEMAGYNDIYQRDFICKLVLTYNISLEQI